MVVAWILNKRSVSNVEEEINMIIVQHVLFCKHKQKHFFIFLYLFFLCSVYLFFQKHENFTTISHCLKRFFGFLKKVDFGEKVFLWYIFDTKKTCITRVSENFENRDQWYIFDTVSQKKSCITKQQPLVTVFQFWVFKLFIQHPTFRYFHSNRKSA